MKKLLLSLVLVATLVALGAPQAEAADIGVTVTITATLSVSVDKTAWAIGSIYEADIATTQTHPVVSPLGTITANNTSNTAADLTITISNSSNWTAAGSPGADQFAMQASKDAGSNWDIIGVPGGYSLATDLAAGGSQGFDLMLMVPTSTTVGGTEQTITVTVTAS